MISCKKCGHLNEDGSKFCAGCGEKFQENQTEAKLNTKNGYNKNAVCSLVFSLISLVIFWWLGFAGVSCGIAALNEIKTKGGKGKGLAIAGIIVSIIDIIFYFAGRILISK